MKKHRSHPTETVDLDQIRADLASPDAAVRARAARQVCPCRLGWDGFEQCMDPVKKLQKDPSPPVRRAALHVFEDALEMENGALPTSPQTLTQEMAARKRRLRWQPLEEPEALPLREKEKKQRRREAGRKNKGLPGFREAA
jgi:hypothetical protein